MTKKVVLKLGVHDEKAKKKAMKSVASLSGVESLTMDMKEKKMTVVGEVDPIEIVEKLKKRYNAGLLTVGPAKEAEKKIADATKKEDPKKTDADKTAELLELWKNHYHHHYNPSYVVYRTDENPNCCVIC